MIKFIIGRSLQFSTQKNYYAILGIPRNATPEEIKEKFYKLAKTCHPDVNPNLGQMFSMVSEAYIVIILKENKNKKILSNPQKRTNYDNQTNTVLSNQYDPKQSQYQLDPRMYQKNQKYHYQMKNDQKSQHPEHTPQGKYVFGQHYTEYLKNEQDWIQQKIRQKRDRGESEYLERPKSLFADFFDGFDNNKNK